MIYFVKLFILILRLRFNPFRFLFVLQFYHSFRCYLFLAIYFLFTILIFQYLNPLVTIFLHLLNSLLIVAHPSFHIFMKQICPSILQDYPKYLYVPPFSINLFRLILFYLNYQVVVIQVLEILVLPTRVYNI